MWKIMERFKAGEVLKERDRRALAEGCNYGDARLDDDYEFIKAEEDEELDWTRCMRTIFKLGKDEYWCIPWERGLTEEQDNEFFDDPYRVKKVVKTVQIETWEEMRSDV